MNVSKGELKARMFEYFRKVEADGEPLIVTDRGVPVLVVQPYLPRKSATEVFGPLRGKVKYSKDVWSSENDEWGELG